MSGMNRRGSISMEPVTVTQDVIDDASAQLPALHDLKMKFNTVQLHKNALERGHNKNPRNGGIFPTRLVLRENIHAKIAIYPKITTVDISCTIAPLIYNSRGAHELIGHVERIRDYLYNNFGADDIPHSLDWIVTQYHLNQDGKKKLSDSNFHRTFEDVIGGFIRAYAKKFQDGAHLRLERIITPNCSMKDQIQDMVNVGNYLNSPDKDISHIMPSQILAANKLGEIMAKRSSLYSLPYCGIYSF